MYQVSWKLSLRFTSDIATKVISKFTNWSYKSIKLSRAGVIILNQVDLLVDSEKPHEKD